jgi:hypothetical protein
MIGSSSLPPAWQGVTLAYDFAGGSLVNLADPGVNDLTTPGSAPGVVTGLNGDAIHISGSGTRVELISKSVYLGPESTHMGWFKIPGTGVITGSIWETTRDAAGPYYTNNFGGRTDQQYITLTCTAATGFSGVVPTYGQNKWNFFCLRTYTSGWTWNVADTTTYDADRTNTGTIQYADGVNNTRLRPGSNGSNYLSYVDSFRLFDRALSDDEVLEHWNSGAGLTYGS